MEITREQIVAVLVGALEPLDYVHILLEAGSAAFGRLDEYSDIDLVADCDDGREGDTLRAAEAALTALGLLDGSYELPLPTWHGMQQCFWHLAGSSEFLLVDFCARPLSKAGLFTEREQHGEALIYFDKRGLAQMSRALDHEQLAASIARRLDYCRATFGMFAPLAKKEALRGHPLDALTFYQQFVIKPLVELLRIRYCPARYSFGLRYLQYDLPPEQAALLAELAYVRDMNDLLHKYEQACAIVRSELTALLNQRQPEPAASDNRSPK